MKGEWKKMVTIRDVPAEVRWALATKAANDFSFTYPAAVRSIVGEMFDAELSAMETQMWAGFGKEQATLAKGFGFPLRTARHVADAFSTLSVLLQGPEIDNGEVRDGPGDSAIITIEACPMLKRAKSNGISGEAVLQGCRAYTQSSVSSLNPDYEVSFNRSMCRGDAACEMQVNRARPL